jgi:hypothetical protein
VDNYVKSLDSLNSGANSSDNTKQKSNVDNIEDVVSDNHEANLSNNEDKEKVNKTIIGDWYNEEVNGILSISKNEASFSGGPFSERLRIVYEKNSIKLYFDYIEGSNSFNEAVNSSSINKNDKCKKLVAKCVFKNNLLFYEGFGDDCGQLPKGNFILKAF